ncbi:MAG: DUF4976 domain-containing protein [Fuerstiella sp.]
MERLENPPEWELYDLGDDPVEFVDLSDDPALADVARQLKQALSAWQKRTQDPFADAEFRKNVARKYRELSR